MDSEGVTIVDHLEKGKPINGQYNASEIRQLKKAIVKMQRVAEG